MQRLMLLEDSEVGPFCNTRQGKEDLATGCGSLNAMFA